MAKTENVKDTTAQKVAPSTLGINVQRKQKVTTPIKKLAPTESFIGKLISRREKAGEVLNQKTGEFEAVIWVLLKFAGPTGEMFEVFEDAGLKGAMSQAEMKEGSDQFYEVIKLEKVQLAASGRKGARQCNQYDIYEVTLS